MNRFDQVLKNVKQLDQYEILRITLDTQDVRQLIVDLNTKKQLGIGIDSEGEFLTPQYAISYASFKQGLPDRNAPFGVPDLNLSGDYWRTYHVEIQKNGDFEITSNPNKGDKNLLFIYGPAVEGLTEDNIEFLAQSIINSYAKNTKEAILQ